MDVPVAARCHCTAQVEGEEQRRARLSRAGCSAFLQGNRVQCRRTQWTWSVRDIPSAPPQRPRPLPLPPYLQTVSHVLASHSYIHEYRHTSRSGPKLKLEMDCLLAYEDTGVRARVCMYNRKKCGFVCTLTAGWNTRRQPSTTTAAHKWTHTTWDVRAVTHAHLGRNSRRTPFLGRRANQCDIEPSDRPPSLKTCHAVVHSFLIASSNSSYERWGAAIRHTVEPCSSVCFTHMGFCPRPILATSAHDSSRPSVMSSLVKPRQSQERQSVKRILQPWRHRSSKATLCSTVKSCWILKYPATVQPSTMFLLQSSTTCWTNFYKVHTFCYHYYCVPWLCIHAF